MPCGGRKLFIAIVNYNSSTYVRECVRSLASVECEIVVLDNASASNDRAVLRKLGESDGRLRIIESSTNVGFGAGFNQLLGVLEAADTDAIWLLNPDTVVHPGAARELTAELERWAGPVLLSPMITRLDGRIWFCGGALDQRRGLSTHVDIGKPVPREPSEPLDATFMSGAALISTAGTWRRMGGFREDLFLYWEDADLSIRAAALGIPLRVVPAAVVEHHEGGSTRGSDPGRSAIFFYYYSRNRLLVCGDGALGRVNVAFGRGLVGTLRQFGLVLLREPVEKRAKLWAVARGMIHGICGSSGRWIPRGDLRTATRRARRGDSS